ncbi:hypothetical protein IV203_007212 [Nitzschia inconspicua]|uniref:Uncharacterized protein n=1 Tax=Nitzschia inconspicua TaxID=303405 RepID=A0A9K3KFE9_9STRA|nr:hypothetical protein IV203_007209 [Nitzschia inconspicua]KAG7342120.1 hypothetical protein IV203_007212 [Nitzschia inconspicua]
MTKFATISFLSLSALMIGCSNVEAQMVETDSTEHRSARAKWESLQSRLGLLDYKYGFTNASSRSELSTTYIVLVEQDKVVEVEPFFWSDQQLDPSQFSTVNDFFDLIFSSIEANSSVRAVYDDTHGYPSELTIVNNEIGVHVNYVIDLMTIYSVAQEELDRNKALWTKTSTENYDYTLRLSCFCIPSATLPKRIEVRKGVIETIIDLETGMESENFFFSTLQDQFKEIQDAIRDRWNIISTSYDDTLGYPARVFFDIHHGMSHDERLTEVKDVVIFGFPSFDEINSFSPTAAPFALETSDDTEFSLFPNTSTIVTGGHMIGTSRAYCALPTMTIALVTILTIVASIVVETAT